jgi:hypothetical protein
MKKFVLFLFTLSFLNLYSQSELLIPRDAVTVFSINNVSLLQKISMDELVQYDFMEEVHQELFDGSTAEKTLKDSGIDFNQRLNVFYGKSDNSELSGFTFGVSNTKNLFEVFDDFEELQSKYSNVKIYGSFFNNLVIKNNTALLIRIEPSSELIDAQTDSIWYSRGNSYPYGYDPYDDDEFSGEIIFEEEVFDEEDSLISPESNDFPIANEDPTEKNYYELRDSVQLELQKGLLTNLLDELLIENANLVSSDAIFKDQLTHPCEGTFYLDNSRSLSQTNSLWYFQTVMPSLYKDIKELYTGNIILGDLFLKEQSIEFLVEARYGEKLGSIYQEMNDSKFDKNITKYIHKGNSAYFTYNVNMRKAYEKAYEVLMPILSSEKNSDIAMNVLAFELLNELVNKDALFETYRGSMFGTFNGIKKINTKKIEFYYDEETFEYGEKETEATEDMPVFTIGFSIGRGDIPEIILKNLGRVTSKFEKHDDYWVFKNAILDAAPLYMINKNDLFIFTNDEDLAINHSDGYGSNSLPKKIVKELKKEGFMNGYIDIAGTLNRFPSDLLNERRTEMINSLKGKSGKMYLESSKTTNKSTNFKMTYEFRGDENSGKHLLDLVNTIYIFSK